MSKLLRLDFVRDEAGIALAVGDIFTSPINRAPFTVEEHLLLDDEDNVNYKWHRDSECHIKSFAPRKNEGMQPVDDDIVVDGATTSLSLGAWQAKHVSWDIVKTWKPNYDALLKMQNEFDEKESEVIADDIDTFSPNCAAELEMITDKEMKIVEAVNKLESNLDNLLGMIRPDDTCIVKIKGGEYFSCLAIPENIDNLYFGCTIAEFNQCIEEMAAAEWLTGKVHNYVVHKHICQKHMGIDTSNKRLQKEVAQPIYTKAMQDAGEMPSVGMVCDIQYRSGNLFKGFTISYMSEFGFVTKNPVSGVESFCGNVDIVHFLAPRTPEEIEAEELEVAKVEQVDAISNLLANQGMAYDPILIKCLQSHGHLAEIILPSKG